MLERFKTEDEAILVEMEEKFHGHLTFVASNNMHMEEFTITNAETGEELYSNIERKG